MSVINSYKETLTLMARYSRDMRIMANLTQKALAESSGVPLGTLREFEQKGKISLENFLKLHTAMGSIEMLNEFIKAVDISYEENISAPVKTRVRRNK